MKFLLVGLLAALGMEAQASKYSQDLSDAYMNSILNKYGNQYSNKNIGLGLNNQWSGQNNKWLGNSNKIQGRDQFVFGNQNDVSGASNRVTGNKNQVSGQNSRVTGQNNKVSGQGNIVMGSGNIVRNSLSSKDFDTDSWFPDWMKQSKTSNTKNHYTPQSVYKKGRNDDFNMNFPAWMNNEQDIWSRPNVRKSPKSQSRVQYSNNRYDTYSYRPNYVSSSQRDFRYPYATSFSISQPSYYNPWNSWQQFYGPTRQDFFRGPYQSNRYNVFQSSW